MSLSEHRQRKRKLLTHKMRLVLHKKTSMRPILQLPSFENQRMKAYIWSFFVAGSGDLWWLMQWKVEVEPWPCCTAVIRSFQAGRHRRASLFVSLPVGLLHCWCISHDLLKRDVKRYGFLQCRMWHCPFEEILTCDIQNSMRFALGKPVKVFILCPWRSLVLKSAQVTHQLRQLEAAFYLHVADTSNPPCHFLWLLDEGTKLRENMERSWQE